MSQEEEKLIEEFKKTSEGKYYSEVGYKMWHRDILKAFRSGKLAGFEVCEKIVKKIDGELNFEASDSNLIYSESIHRAKSLIEEEKKKL